MPYDPHTTTTPDPPEAVPQGHSETLAQFSVSRASPVWLVKDEFNSRACLARADSALKGGWAHADSARVSVSVNEQDSFTVGRADKSPLDTPKRSPKLLLAVERAPDLAATLDQAGADVQAYYAFHRRRYAYLLSLLDHLDRSSPLQRVLDVGPFIQTQMMRERFANAAIDSLGITDPRFLPRAGESHYEFDLNDMPMERARPDLREYDAIVFSEVLEHLRIAPASIFRLLASALRPGGSIIVQTPNACSIHKRIAVLRGRNPFQMITTEDPDAKDLGHIREFTVDEILTLGRSVGLEVVDWKTKNYFDAGATVHKVFVAMTPVLPRRLRDGMTFVFRRPEDARPH
jgi:trans-aconitate methyltransferase